MATIDTRTDSKGNVKHRVRWREGGTRDGKWQSATFTKLKGERGAERFKAKVEAAGHHWPDDADTSGALSVPGVVTLDELAKQYLEDRKRRVRSDRTPADYRRDYDNWIAPHFGGSTMVDTITEGAVQAWVDGMADGTITRPGRKGPLAAKTIQDRHALLFQMFDYATAPSRKWVEHNPCAGTDLPKRQKKNPKGLNPNEWAALYASLRLVDSDAADLALFLLASGWRWSEATALTGFDVEDYGDALFVNMAQVIRRNAAGQHVVVEEGKGEASLRRIQLDEEAAAMVRRRMVGRPAQGLVFTTGRVAPGGSGGRANGLGGSQWHYSNFVNRYWNPAVKGANLGRRPTPHWLRHTAVVWLSRSGASLAELQARIGHESIQTTIGVYGSMLTDVSPSALQGFAAMRAGVLPQGPEIPASITAG
jgi:integrase